MISNNNKNTLIPYPNNINKPYSSRNCLYNDSYNDIFNGCNDL